MGNDLLAYETVPQYESPPKPKRCLTETILDGLATKQRASDALHSTPAQRLHPGNPELLESVTLKTQLVQPQCPHPRMRP